MADDTQVAQPQQKTSPPSALKYYTTKGADGKWYQTQAASPQEAQQKLAKVKQPPAQPGIGKRFAETMMIPTSKEGLKNALQGASGAGALYQTGKSIYEGGKAAVEDAKAGRLLKAAMEVVTPLAPFPAMLGSNTGQDIRNKNYRGLVGTGLGLVTQAALAGLGEHEIQPERLRVRAAELNTKVLKQAEAGARDYKTSSGLQVAQEQIVGTARALPGKIEQVRAAKNTEVIQRAQAADKAGTIIDVTADIKPIVQEVAQIANARGQWSAQLRTQVGNLLQRVTQQTDLKTGAQIPRDLSKLSVSQALQLEKGLEDLSAFGKEAPAAINNLARRLRGALNDKLPSDIQKLRGEESKLITARDAARKNWEQILNDKSSAGRGVLYKGAGPVAVYFGLKAIGLGGLSAPFLGTVVLYKALASTPSRTLRAALYARAADMLDGATRASAGATGSVQPGSALQGPLGPKPAQPTQNRALTGQSAAPFADASVVSQNPPPVARPRGTELPVSATRARAGSGDYVRSVTEPKAVKTNVAVSNTKNKAMLDRLDTLLERQAKPKSAMDNAAIQREIGELKKLIGGEAVPGATKRIADRERLAGKRQQAAAQVTPQATGVGGEPIAQTSSPEMRSIALDAGYKKLGSYEGGAEMVKALRSTSKAMQKIDPSYDEVEKLTEALEIMKQIGGDLK